MFPILWGLLQSIVFTVFSNAGGVGLSIVNRASKMVLMTPMWKKMEETNLETLPRSALPDLVPQLSGQVVDVTHGHLATGVF